MGCNQSTSVTVDKSNQPTSTTTYTLSYFDFTGRAEVSRLLFSLAGQKFEDKRLSPQEWGALKPKSQTGGMPILEVDGQSISQSIAIARFVARRFGFAGKNNVEAAQADMIVDWISDVINAAMALAKAGEEEKTKFLEETLPNGLETLEKLLNGKKFFVGKQVTWADIMFYSTFGILLPTTYQLPVPWEKAPHGHKLLERVAQIPQVKKWVNKEVAPEDSKYTLTYFDFTGRAEVSRLLFALAKQDFEDKRVSPQEWGAMKPNSMTGGLPELEVNGHTISQSLSIARAIARRFGFAGKNNVEAAQADMIVDCISELVNATMVLSGIPKDEQGETREKLTSETIPASLETLEKNLGGKKYFVGNNVTWADVMYFAALAILLPKTYGLDIDWNTAPHGKQLLERVGKIPQIKTYMEKS